MPVAWPKRWYREKTAGVGWWEEGGLRFEWVEEACGKVRLFRGRDVRP